MVGKYRLYVSVSVLVALVSILFSGIVSADDEPNDDSSSAETITAGTYTGSVNEIEGDSGDWYRVDNIGSKEVKVSLKRLDYQDTEYVNVNSYGAYAISPDGQVQLYVGEGWSEDSCHWSDTDGLGTMFLSVTGNGQYEIKIEFEDEEEENPIIETPADSCCGLTVALLIVGLIVISFLIGYLKKQK